MGKGVVTSTAVLQPQGYCRAEIIFEKERSEEQILIFRYCFNLQHSPYFTAICTLIFLLKDNLETTLLW